MVKLVALKSRIKAFPHAFSLNPMLPCPFPVIGVIVLLLIFPLTLILVAHISVM